MPDISIRLQGADQRDLVRIDVPARSSGEYMLGNPPVAVHRMLVINATPPAPPAPEIEGVVAFLRAQQPSCATQYAVLDLAADILEGS